jgi:hypothetical protein
MSKVSGLWTQKGSIEVTGFMICFIVSQETYDIHGRWAVSSFIGHQRQMYDEQQIVRFSG